MGVTQSTDVYYPPPIAQQRYNPIPQFFPYLHVPLSSGTWETLQHGKIMRKAPHDPYVLCGVINRAPPNNTLDFKCPHCNHRQFDGGLCKKVVCRCGKSLLRLENEEIK